MENTLEKVQNAVEESHTIQEMCFKLGYKTFSPMINKYLKDHNIDYSHLIDSKKTIDKLSNEEFTAIIQNNNCLLDILKQCGYKSYKGSKLVQARCEKLGLDFSHVRDYAHSQTHSNENKIGKCKYSLDEILIENSWYSRGPVIINRLIREKGWERKCVGCNRSVVRAFDKLFSIPLELDHINGVHTDNRIENLRFLCGVCHALTPTYCGRNANYTSVDYNKPRMVAASCAVTKQNVKDCELTNTDDITVMFPDVVNLDEIKRNKNQMRNDRNRGLGKKFAMLTKLLKEHNIAIPKEYDIQEDMEQVSRTPVKKT